jgi:hypothetical protein
MVWLKDLWDKSNYQQGIVPTGNLEGDAMCDESMVLPDVSSGRIEQR